MCRSVISVSDEGEISDTIPVVLQETVSQLNDYFEGKRTAFTFKMNPSGTEFQRKVWQDLLEIPFVWQGGMAIQGGVILGTIVGIIYTKKHNIDSWAFADLFAPAIILGQSVGRMANLMNGDAFGHPTGGNFGIIYPETTLAYKTYGAQPLWPAEVWEGQLDVLIFVILLLFSCRRHAKGQVFVLYAILYSTARFFLEFLRGDYVNLTMGLKSAQMTSLIVIIIGIIIFLYLEWKDRKDRKAEINTSAAVMDSGEINKPANKNKRK